MDLVSSCKDKLVSFRIKELKDVLSKLGLSKQGKKQDLVDRILATLSNDQVSRMLVKKNAVGKEEVAKLVDDTFRKMNILGATDLASKGQCGSDSSNVKVKPKEECNDSFKKIRCPCGISLETEPIVQCDDPKCRIWQHIGCVVVPEKPMDPPPQIPDLFYCEVCRLSRADPFLVTIAHPLLPVKLTATSVPTDSTNPVQSVDKTFQLTRADKDLLSKPDYDVQAWCILLSDKVPFRMQWPQYADLQVNGLPVRAINRPGSQLLGINGRDDGPVITPFTKDGINKIALSGCDSRIFCLGVRIVKRRTMQQILNLIPKESDGERFEDALARVCRCVGCGTTTDNADSDSDLEVVADSFTVSLRCPMSGSRIKVAGRFKPCPHMGCFDLDTFVEMNQRSRKWQCPVCLKNYSLENVIIDPYFNRITSKMRNCVEDVTDIEVKPDGCWRLKDGTVTGELQQWHLPDGAAVCPPDIDREIKPKMEVSKQVKQEVGLDGHASLKLGIKKNRNGCWEVSKPEDNTSPGNMLHDRFESNDHKVIPMSSSAAGSGPDGEDASVNQDVCEDFDFSPTVDPMHGFCDENPSALVHDPEVIVLSDSEEEIGKVSSGDMYENNVVDANGVPYHNPREVSNSYTEDPTLGPGWNTCLGLFNSNDEEFGPVWPLPPSTQTGSGFQLFGSDAVVSDALVNLQHDSMDRAIPINGYTLAPETAMASVLVPDSSIDHPNCGINDGLVDNPLAFDGNDPSLQIFLPTGPSDASEQSSLRDQVDLSNANRSDDWISLRIGHSCSGGDNDFEAGNGLNSRERPLPKEDIMNCVPGTASLFPGTNDGRSEKVSRQRSDSDSPFSFPRVRQRLILSIDSDSE